MSIVISLIVLALVDSTSIGTLVLPLLIVVVANQVHWGLLANYFRTVVGLYFAIGLALLLGAGVVVDTLGDVLDARPVYWVLLVLGVALFAYSWKMDGAHADPDRLKTMVERGSQPGAIIGLALAAVAMEVATMVPYLGAIGLISTSDWNWLIRIAVLALYCLVMILPAVVLIGAASLFGKRLWGRLERLSGWIARQTEETIAWVVGIAGFLLAGYSATALDLL